MTDPILCTAPGRRISIIGLTGSGKTTLARQLSARLGLVHVELDALHWEPNWGEPPLEIFRERVAQALSGESWVIDGNYSKVRDLIWSRADTVIWLDYRLPFVLRRVLYQERLWNGNRERFAAQFLSRDSLFLWAIKSNRKQHREYPLLFQRPDYSHLTVIHLTSPRRTERWLSTIGQE